jgi:hypothetical protein
MNTNENLNNNIKKLYAYNDEVSRANTPFFSEAYMDPKKHKRMRVWGMVILVIFLVIFYSMSDDAKGIFCFWFFAIFVLIFLPIAYIIQTKRGVVQLAKSDLTAFALTNQDELYLIIAKPEQFGKDIATIIGVDIVTSSEIAFGGTVYAQGVAEQKRKINLTRCLANPMNISNILKQKEKIKQEFEVYRINKTLELTEKNTHYKGLFLAFNVIKNKEIKKKFNVGKVYSDYLELINILNSKK